MRAERVEVLAKVRSQSEVGKIACRRIRAQGRIPAVVYGRDSDPIAVSVDEEAFSRVVPPTAWYSTVIDLNIQENGDEQETPTVMIKEVQSDLVYRKIWNIDFRRISLKEVIQTQVPVRYFGESPGVKQGGIVDQVTHEVMIECLPTDVPDHLEIDISGLDIGDSVRVRNLEPPSGIKVLSAEDDAVIVIAPPLREEEVAAPEEEALLEEAAEPELIGEKPEQAPDEGASES